MIETVTNIVLPLLTGALLITVVYTLVRMILDAFGLSFLILKILLFLGVYYFVGPYVLELLENGPFPNIDPVVRLIFIPIQTILG